MTHPQTGRPAASLDRRARRRRLLDLARPHRGPILLILLLTLITAALNAVEPLVLKAIFDGLGASAPVGSLTFWVMAILALAVGRELVGGVCSWMTWRTRLAVHQRLLEATVGKLHSLPLDYHRSESVGAVMTRLDRGIQGFLGSASEIAFNVLPSLVYLAISLAVMLRLDWRLSAIALAFAPVPALIGVLAAPEQTRRERDLLDRWGRIYGRFNEVLSGIVTVKSFAMEEEEKRRFLHDVEDANRVVVRGVRTDAITGSLRAIVVAVARVVALAVGVRLVMAGQVTAGTLVAFLSYIGGLFGPVQGLTGVYQTVRKAAVSLDVLFSILDARESFGDAPDAREMHAVRGAVEFEGVSFAYQEGQSRVLSGIDLRVEPGETVALVGPSGGGKTTMMALLQRLYDPTEGAIRIDGVDLREVRQRSLRKQIGVVLQDALLFNDSVRANIAYGRPDATDEEIVAAARAANAHDFIMALPQGYDTRVGERGGLLSAGQRQRVAIARALLKDPPILILDEATSALDAESEALVQEALERLVRGRTTFVIAHRLATVVSADRIVVLKGGRIVESGRHAELVRKGGYYARLVSMQVRGLIRAEMAA